MKYLLVGLAALAFIFGIVMLLRSKSPVQQLEKEVTTFQECKQAGYPLKESYPRTCQTPGGKIFTEDIGNAVEHQDRIRVDSPRPNTILSNPFTLKGEARGTWFFEGSFPVILEDESGNELMHTAVRAQSDWMTENFVSFSTQITFTTPSNRKGTLILKKDNPSGIPEKEDELRIPVEF